MAVQSPPSVAAHFKKSTPAVRATYDAIVRASRTLGRVREDPKKTSIHLVRDIAFAGVATRKDALILTLKSTRAIKSPRVHRAEQASANRWHLEIRLQEPKDVDRQLRQWLADAFELA